MILKTVYEKNENSHANLMPWYHVHVGGLLYPDIEESLMLNLFYESLHMCSYFKEYLINVPTIIALNSDENNNNYTCEKLIEKCEKIKKEYTKYCKSNDNILLDPNNFYKSYSKKEFDNMNEKTINYFNYHDLYTLQFKNSLKPYMYDSIKYPFVSVMEPKINYIEVMEKINITSVHYNTHVNEIKFLDNKYFIRIENGVEFDDVFLCTGHGINEINMNYGNNKFKNILKKELKQSFIVNKTCIPHVPEIAIVGKRNTINGLISISPFYCEQSKLFNLVHLHWLNEISTLIPSDELNLKELIEKSAELLELNINDYLYQVNKHITNNIFPLTESELDIAEEYNFKKIQCIRAINNIIACSKYFKDFENVKYDVNIVYGGYQIIYGETPEERINKNVKIENMGDMLNICISKGTSALFTIDNAIKQKKYVNPNLLFSDIDKKVTNLIMFIRHGPRYPLYTITGIHRLLDNEKTNDGQLTENGSIFCELFGKYIKHVYDDFIDKNIDIITSDTDRTNDTMIHIYKGMFNENLELNAENKNNNLFLPNKLSSDDKNYFEERKNKFNSCEFDKDFYKDIIEKLDDKIKMIKPFKYNNDYNFNSECIHAFFELRQVIKYLESENNIIDILDKIDIHRLDLLVTEYFNYVVDDIRIMNFLIEDLIKIIYNKINNTSEKKVSMICIHDWQIFALAKYFSSDKQNIKIPEYCSNVRIEIDKINCKIYYDDKLIAYKNIFEILGTYDSSRL
jgi:hypothetical protein